jgi:hypothetical protein
MLPAPDNSLQCIEVASKDALHILRILICRAFGPTLSNAAMFLFSAVQSSRCSYCSVLRFG